MKKNLVVMFGGPSVEHDVSIITGQQIIKNADTAIYDVMPVYWNKEGGFVTASNLNVTPDEMFLDLFKNPSPVLFGNGAIYLQKKRLLRHTQEIHTVDAAILGFHGTGGEDGAAQGFLEVAGIPYAGSNVAASAVGMDKLLFKSVAGQYGVSALDCEIIRKQEVAELKKISFAYPVIVKPAHLGSSIGVRKATTFSEVQEALEVIFELDTVALIEPYLSDMTEINCSVLGSSISAKASVCEEPLSADQILSFEDKYLRGGKGDKSGSKGMAGLDRRIPAPIAPAQAKKIQELAVEVFQACGCSGVARVDFMIDHKSKNIYVTEINTIPGSLSFYLWEASGISFTELIDELVSIAEKEYAMKNSLLRTYDSPILEKIQN